MEAGRCRNDLYYRLSVISLHIPSLREHREDIWPLVKNLAEKHLDFGASFEDIIFDGAAKSALLSYDWPGNVRELENAVICFLTKMKDDKVFVRDLPPGVSGANTEVSVDELHTVECRTIETALRQCKGHVSKAAKMLGISRATLYRKIERHQLKISRL